MNEIQTQICVSENNKIKFDILTTIIFNSIMSSPAVNVHVERQCMVLSHRLEQSHGTIQVQPKQPQ